MWGESFACSLGRVLACLHQASEGRALGLGNTAALDWDRIEELVHTHVDVALVRRALPRVRAWDEAGLGKDVLVHGDPHFHNVFGTEDGAVLGLIDFDEAAIGNRHEDLAYLHSQGPRFAELAMDAYADEAGVDVDKELVRRLHVRCAFEHFEWVGPETERFPRIVAWAAEALQALAPDWLT